VQATRGGLRVEVEIVRGQGLQDVEEVEPQDCARLVRRPVRPVGEVESESLPQVLPRQLVGLEELVEGRYLGEQ
jgi:hypothetical protein